jgi:hypothetical protein
MFARGIFGATKRAAPAGGGGSLIFQRQFRVGIAGPAFFDFLPADSGLSPRMP